MIYLGIDITKLNYFAAAVSSDGEILIELFKFTNDYDGSKCQALFTPYGNIFFTPYGKEIFIYSGKQFFTLFGKEFFTPCGMHFFIEPGSVSLGTRI